MGAVRCSQSVLRTKQACYAALVVLLVLCCSPSRHAYANETTTSAQQVWTAASARPSRSTAHATRHLRDTSRSSSMPHGGTHVQRRMHTVAREPAASERRLCSSSDAHDSYTAPNTCCTSLGGRTCSITAAGGTVDLSIQQAGTPSAGPCPASKVVVTSSERTGVNATVSSCMFNHDSAVLDYRGCYGASVAVAADAIAGQGAASGSLTLRAMPSDTLPLRYVIIRAITSSSTAQCTTGMTIDPREPSTVATCSLELPSGSGLHSGRVEASYTEDGTSFACPGPVLTLSTPANGSLVLRTCLVMSDNAVDDGFVQHIAVDNAGSAFDAGVFLSACPLTRLPGEPCDNVTQTCKGGGGCLAGTCCDPSVDAHCTACGLAPVAGPNCVACDATSYLDHDRGCLPVRRVGAECNATVQCSGSSECLGTHCCTAAVTAGNRSVATLCSQCDANGACSACEPDSYLSGTGCVSGAPPPHTSHPLGLPISTGIFIALCVAVAVVVSIVVAVIVRYVRQRGSSSKQKPGTYVALSPDPRAAGTGSGSQTGWSS